MHPIVFLGLVVAVLGGGLTIWGLNAGNAAKRRIALAQHWPEATAVVVAHDVQVHRVANRYSHEPKLRYRFQTGGHEFEGDRLRFGYVRTNFDRQARSMMAPYPLGSWIRVRHDPYNPADNVGLGQSNNQAWSVAMGIVVLVAGLALLIAGLSGAFPGR